MITTAENGLYQPGQTLLHRLDPRVKVFSCLLLVMLAFAATDWRELFPLVMLITVALWFIPSLLGPIWRFCWMLRWLLLFTLLMHVFFSPGRTLWGFSWLSLDGLLMGGLVCGQMLLAIIVSALLAITTSTERLASTFGWFVQPLQWLGCKTEEWQKVLLLTIDFIPVVQTEIRVSAKPGAGDCVEPSQPISNGPWAVWTQKLQCLLLRLVDRGDKIAHRIAMDEDSSRLPATLLPLFPMALLDRLFALLITLLATSFWLAG